MEPKMRESENGIDTLNWNETEYLVHSGPVRNAENAHGDLHPEVFMTQDCQNCRKGGSKFGW